MSNRDVIEWTLDKVLKDGNELLDEFYFNRDKCVKILEKELNEYENRRI